MRVGERNITFIEMLKWKPSSFQSVRQSSRERQDMSYFQPQVGERPMVYMQGGRKG